MDKNKKTLGENQESSSKFDFAEFNKFQTYFFTNINMFDGYTTFEMKKHSVRLLTNIGKSFPQLANDILNIYSDSVKAIESRAILIALQRTKFINGFSNPRIPQEIYYKQNKPKPAPKRKAVKRKTLKGDEFTDDVKAEIQSKLMYDDKDYEAFKFTQKVQDLGRMLLNNSNKPIYNKLS